MTLPFRSNSFDFLWLTKPLVIVVFMLQFNDLKSQQIDFWKLDSLRQGQEQSLGDIRNYALTFKKDSPEYQLVCGLSFLFELQDSIHQHLDIAKKKYLDKKDSVGYWNTVVIQNRFRIISGEYDGTLEPLRRAKEFALRAKNSHILYNADFAFSIYHYLVRNFDLALEHINLAIAEKPNFYPEHYIAPYYQRLISWQSIADYHQDSLPQFEQKNIVKEADRLAKICLQHDQVCMASKILVIKFYSMGLIPEYDLNNVAASLDSLLDVTARNDCFAIYQFVLSNIIVVKSRLKQPFDQIERLKASAQIASDPNYRAWIFDIIADNYMAQGDFENSAKYRDTAKTEMELLHEKELVKATVEQEVLLKKYEQQLENELLETQIQRERANRQRIIFGASILMVLIVVTGLALWYFKLNQRKQLEQENLSRNMLEAEQQERRRIARDLHDSVGQMLSAVKMNLSGISQDEKAQKASTILDRTIEEVRSISHNLMPESIERLGLIQTIEDLALQYNYSGNVKISVLAAENIDDKSLNVQQSMLLYRILQESIQNIIKHTSSREIGINIHGAGHDLKIDLSYEGPKIETDKIENSKGIGWKNIFYRIKLLNGYITFDHIGNQAFIKLSIATHATK